MEFGIFELTTVVVIAAVMGVLAKSFRQPLILGYIATGILIGAVGFFRSASRDFFTTFSEMGIMFLLFLVGMEINYASLRRVGKSVIVLGLGQMLVTSFLGYEAARFLGFGATEAIYIGLGLSFSSTIIAIKLISEKHDQSSLYGKLAIGMLLVEDLVAIVALVVISTIANGGGGESVIVPLVSTLVQGLVVFLALLWLGRKVLSRVFDWVANAHELLFVISLGWVFLVVTLMNKIGFSVEIGGFLAGIAIANSSEHFQIANRIRPLRDFFLLMFFTVLGSSLILSNFTNVLWAILVFAAIPLVLKPLIIMVMMGILRYRKRTTFMTGITLSQISEFSLILAALGLKVGHVSEGAASAMTGAAILSIVGSTYGILNGDKLVRRFSGLLTLFERKVTREEHDTKTESHAVILIGAHRVGRSIIKYIPKEDLLVIDFDPETIARLKSEGISYVFGDVADEEVLEYANLGAAKLVICTSPDVNDNLLLMEAIAALPAKPRVVVRAENEKDAEILYKEGADYVLLPHMTSGQYLGKTLAVDPEMRHLDHLRQKDLETLFTK